MDGATQQLRRWPRHGAAHADHGGGVGNAGAGDDDQQRLLCASPRRHPWWRCTCAAAGSSRSPICKTPGPAVQRDEAPCCFALYAAAGAGSDEYLLACAAPAGQADLHLVLLLGALPGPTRSSWPPKPPDAGVHRRPAGAYMTIPLMDDILIPYQERQGHRPLAGGDVPGAPAAGGAAGLGFRWARTYILALVSERIGADSAHHHLRAPAAPARWTTLAASALRAPDGAHRLGDRPHQRLSVAERADVIDVLERSPATSAILFSINPWLALVTLVPLPFTARSTTCATLRTGFEKIDRVWSEVTNAWPTTIPGILRGQGCPGEPRGAALAPPTSTTWRSPMLNKTWSLVAWTKC